MTEAELLSEPLACLCHDIRLPTATGAPELRHGIYKQRPDSLAGLDGSLSAFKVPCPSPLS
jgi:hypothetical protein